MAPSRLVCVIVAGALGAATGCSPYGGGAFTCTDSAQCSTTGQAGTCEPTGFCSFADGSCTSGRRYGGLSGALANTCVGDEPPDAGLDGAPDGSMPPIDAPVAPFCDPANLDIAACYEFEGTTADGSPNHLDATMTNVSFVAGKVGMAVQLSGTSAVDVAESPALDVPSLTIEAWIYPTTIPAAGTRSGIVDNQGQYGFFLHPNGDLKCTALGALQAVAAVPANQWTHVACTYDQSTITIYANGVAVDSIAQTGALGTGGTSGISIGADNPPGSGSPLVGLMDQLRILSAARTATEICHDAGQTSCP